MSNRLVLRDHKAFVVSEQYHPQTEHYETVERESGSLVSWLSACVEIGDRFAFGDLWRLIEKDASTYNLVFQQALGGYPLDLYIEDAKKTPKPVENAEADLLHLEVCWDVDCGSWKDESAAFTVYHGFQGWGPHRDSHTGTVGEVGRHRPGAFCGRWSPPGNARYRN